MPSTTMKHSGATRRMAAVIAGTSATKPVSMLVWMMVASCVSGVTAAA